MKKSLSIVLLVVSVLSGCAFTEGFVETQKSAFGQLSSPTSTDMATPVQGASYAPTDHDKIQLFFSGKPQRKYKVIGDVVVGTDNSWGMNKSESDVRKAMSDKAASIGGDGVIDIKRNLNTMTGQVIRYSYYKR